MDVWIHLIYEREPELVALRNYTVYDFDSIARYCIRADINNEDFSFDISKKGSFCSKSLRFKITFDDVMDADIIGFFNSSKVKKSAIVKNSLLRHLSGDVSYIYSDKKLISISKRDIKKDSVKKLFDSKKNKTPLKNVPPPGPDISQGAGDDLFSRKMRQLRGEV